MNPLKENLEKSPDEKYPDKDAPMTNCFGYVYYKLGLDPEKIGFMVDLDDFDQVPDIKDANAILFIDARNGQHVHMVHVGSNGTISHRGNFGWPIEPTSTEKLQERYEPERFKMVLLRAK
ncbi:MAG: hypothetical protein HOO67_07405 [Candidatus Peribacteraceae bacterium]|nr:hypothetical protein [Candidatus Peribacteraceae bacterium]